MALSSSRYESWCARLECTFNRKTRDVFKKNYIDCCTVGSIHWGLYAIMRLFGRGEKYGFDCTNDGKVISLPGCCSSRYFYVIEGLYCLLAFLAFAIMNVNAIVFTIKKEYDAELFEGPFMSAVGFMMIALYLLSFISIIKPKRALAYLINATIIVMICYWGIAAIMFVSRLLKIFTWILVLAGFIIYWIATNSDRAFICGKPSSKSSHKSSSSRSYSKSSSRNSSGSSLGNWTNSEDDYHDQSAQNRINDKKYKLQKEIDKLETSIRINKDKINDLDKMYKSSQRGDVGAAGVDLKANRAKVKELENEIRIDQKDLDKAREELRKL